MSHQTYKEKYEAQKDAFDEYESDSRISIIGYKGARYALISIFVISIILSLLKIDVSYVVDSPNQTIRDLFSLYSFIIFLAPFVWAYSRFKINRIRNKHGYHRIRKEFVYAYQAIENYSNYINDPIRIISKENSKKEINKMFTFINKWDYGNIKLIQDNYKDKIDHIRNNLKQIIVYKIDRDEPKYQNDTYELLWRLMIFLHQNDDSSLNSLYDKMIEDYKDYVDDKTYILKEMVREFVLEYQFSSYIIVMMMFVIVYKIINLMLKVYTNNMGEYLTLIGVAFLLFDAFKKYYLIIE